MTIFLLSELWHGANWTFIVWGAYHALLFLPLLLMNKNRKYVAETVAPNSLLPSFKELVQMIVTFILVLIGWIIFRAESITQAWNYIVGIFNHSILSIPHVENLRQLLYGSIGIVFLTMGEWLNRKKEFGLDFSQEKSPKYIRVSIYIALALIIIYLGGNGQTFIYFQF